MKFRHRLLSVLIIPAVALLSSCSLPGLNNSNSKDSIIIASVSSTEAQIMGHIVKEMITHYTDQEPQLIQNLATSVIVHNAMVRGDANVSAVRYTGTDITVNLQMPAEKDPQTAMEIVMREFESRFQTTWFPSYGFANTYVFTVTQETAEKYNLKTLSDLKNVADQLTVGVDTSWIDRDGDGYRGFQEAYGFSFSSIYPMQISLVYEAVKSGDVDMVLAYSTDGRIASYDLVMLEDDLNFFPPYDASPVATDEILKIHPELTSIFQALEGKITTETMQQLNFKSDNELVEPSVVARQFLEEHNYFESEVDLDE